MSSSKLPCPFPFPVHLSQPQVGLFQACGERDSHGYAQSETKQQLHVATSEFKPGWVFPNFIFVLVASLTFAVIAPLVPLVGCLYFALAYAVYKHQFLFV